ncbi:Transcription factor vib-1 [Ceratocystis fimbriata CBS 114723]|uniref:Transcription factor vib-1 n=2 Tax=Ceratocystis TaxID=5157 RepID=A0A2C5WHI1_9PEZI|nr:Transcription factor vib-1 [Ceratocystis fimbriata CBS 114723]
MTAATASYQASMADLKSEPSHSTMWPSFSQPMHMTSRYATTIDQALSRPRHSVDLPPPYPAFHSQQSSSASAGPGTSSTSSGPPRPYHEEDYDRPPVPQQTYPSLKRPYAATEPAPYQEIIQDLREDTKLNVGHDQKLLSFKRSHDKHTIVDQHGRMQQLEMNAQLHGMFFLSEMPATASDGTALQAELTCYRRNLFQISGSLICPRGQLNVVTESGETVPISSMEVTISAIESVDGNFVRLIVIPWKTPPPNAPDVAQTSDQEPPTLPLIPFQDEGSEADGEYAVYPIGWRRLQFRIATANNGRRKELQQHFVLHLKVIATLANGSKTPVAESVTSPIVVRGRSPRNFQARKEIPLLGSSAGSRGQALVENGIGIVAGPLTMKPDTKRGLDIKPPRSNFTFSAPKLPSAPVTMRSNSYSSPWTANSMSHMPPTPTTYPPTTVSGDSYPKVTLPGTSGFHSDSQDIALQTPVSSVSSIPPVQLSLASQEQGAPIRTQYAYAPSTTGTSQLSAAAVADSSLSVPRYVDGNPRPSKSPRNSYPSGSITTPSEHASEYRYGSSYHDITLNTNTGDFNSGDSSTPNSAPSRDYYPPASTWTSSSESSAPSSAYASDGRSYSFDAYKTGSATVPPPPPAKGPVPSSTAAPLYSSSNYSWNS